MLCCKIGTFLISYFVAYVVLQNLSQQMTFNFCPIFSGAQQHQSALKPAGFGATAQPAVTSGHFGSSTTFFGTTTGAASAFGQPRQQAAGAFGQPAQQAGSIGLFGANNQAKPLGKKPLFFFLCYIF